MFADAAEIAASAVAHYFGSAIYSGDSAWTENNYHQSRIDALAGLKADTTLSGSSSYYSKFGFWSYCDAYYGDNAATMYVAHRRTYVIPSGKRGNITKFRLLANVGAAEFWDLRSYWIYNDFFNYDWNDFGSTLKLFVSSSSSEYGSGDALYTGTAAASYTLADINAANIAAGSEPLHDGDAVNATTRFPYRLKFNLDNWADTINEYESDTFYIWDIMTIPVPFPFLFPDEQLYFDNDFMCYSEFHNPTILVSVN